MPFFTGAFIARTTWIFVTQQFLLKNQQDYFSIIQFLVEKHTIIKSKEAKTKIIEWIIYGGEIISTTSTFSLLVEFKRRSIENDSVLSRRSSTRARKPGVILEYVDEIDEAILYVRDAKEQATRQSVRDIALVISKRETIGDFNASEGWKSISWKFVQATNLIAVSDDKLMRSIWSFLRHNHNKNPILRDEMHVYL